MKSMPERYARPDWVRRMNAMGDAVGGPVEGARQLIPFDPEETLPNRLAEVLAGWHGNPDLRARLGAAAALRARKEFSPAALARGVTAVYRSLVPETPAASPA